MAECLIRKRVYEKNSIDFMLCIGDGLSDEEMFTAIKSHVQERPKDFSVCLFFAIDFLLKIMEI